jgi:hypothetical protein
MRDVNDRNISEYFTKNAIKPQQKLKVRRDLPLGFLANIQTNTQS